MIKGKHIHKFFHWVIMTLLLTFPILMVGISTFGKESQTIDVTETYEYETNEVNSVDDLVVGNIYHFKLENYYIDNTWTLPINYLYINDFTSNVNIIAHYATTKTIFVYSNYNFYCDYQYINNQYFGFSTNTANATINFDSYFVLRANDASIYKIIQYISASDYLGEKNVDYVIHNEDYKQDVNNWITGFLNLPINAWYQSLMNVIGVGFTNSTVMNVIYVMPVYILWVFIFDLVVDCFLVLIRLPHKLLNRLSGGENE